MVSNVMIISSEQQRDSAIHIHVSILPQIPLPSRLPHNIEKSSLCYTIGPCSTEWFRLETWRLVLSKDMYLRSCRGTGSRLSQPQAYWHLGLDNSLLVGWSAQLLTCTSWFIKLGCFQHLTQLLNTYNFTHRYSSTHLWEIKT